jgi:ABC transporter substrate binding protein/molybdopterin-binding aldehyde dehydrogenase-like protein
VWGPIQGQDMVRQTLGAHFKIPAEKVILHTTFLGGSFGRKYVPDFVLHAAVASQAVGRPVKVIRSREDDIRHEYYRPCASARFRAVLGHDGLPKAMHARVVGQSLYGVIKQKAMAAAGGWDETMLDSIYDLIYRVPNLTVDSVDTKQPIPVSFMRSVGSTASVFFLESFIDELANAAKIDPYQYRRNLLAHDARAVAVLDHVAAAAEWEKSPANDTHRGIAFNLYTGRGGAFKTYVAIVAEVGIVKARIVVKRVVCAIDTGTVINPGLVKANIEGGIGFALTNTFNSAITFANGAVEQSNFHDYQLAGKRLEILREVVPGLRRLAIMGHTGNPTDVIQRKEAQAAAHTLGLEVVPAEIRRGEDIAPAFDALKGRADALYVFGDPLMATNRIRINTLAQGARLPTIYNYREFVAAGGLMSYGPNFPDLFRRAADYVDKILHGAKPGDIPVEQPTKFDLVVNLTTAKALGLDVPATLLARADEVIE